MFEVGYIRNYEQKHGRLPTLERIKFVFMYNDCIEHRCLELKKLLTAIAIDSHNRELFNEHHWGLATSIIIVRW
jgi:hypothetical protein